MKSKDNNIDFQEDNITRLLLPNETPSVIRQIGYDTATDRFQVFAVSGLEDLAYLSDLGSGGITALTGDVTASGSGSVVATLATVNSNIGTYNNVTVNAKGLVTAASNVAYLTSLAGAWLTDGSNTGSGLKIGTFDNNDWNIIRNNTNKITLGSSSITFADGTILGTQTTQNIFNTVATTINAFGGATALNIAATAITGTQTISIGQSATPSGSTKNLALATNGLSGSITVVNIGATLGAGTVLIGGTPEAFVLNMATGANASGVSKTVNIATGGLTGSTTNVIMGSAAGTANLTLGFGTVDSNRSTVTLFSSVTTGTLYLNTGNQTVNFVTGASLSGRTKTINIGTSGLSGSTTNINIGSAVSGALGTAIFNSVDNNFRNSVSIGSTSNATSCAILELVSTTKGILIPRLTTAEKTSLPSPVNALKVFDLTVGCDSFYSTKPVTPDWIDVKVKYSEAFDAALIDQQLADAGTAHIVRFKPKSDIVVTGLEFVVTSFGSTETFYCGVYDSALTTKITDGSVSVTATGQQTCTVTSVKLVGGTTYYLVVKDNNGGTNSIGFATTYSTAILCRSLYVGAGALPSSLSSSTADNKSVYAAVVSN